MTRPVGLLVSCVVVGAVATVGSQTPDAPYVTPLTPDEMAGKQLLLDTDRGEIAIDLRPDLAPNHVGLVMKLAEEGAYDGTIFHRMVAHGIIQGGDPLTTDPARADVYGQVADGMDVVTKISETPVDAGGRATDRVTVRAATIRDRPPPEVVPFTTETDAELAAFRAILETDAGSIAFDFYPDRAPRHVRNFLRLVAAGVYDGMAFHRVVPGFVIQSGHLPTRREALTDRQARLVETLEPEFNDTPHVAGIVSMARLDDPGSASMSFFICTDVASELDGQYTAFGVVVDGLDVVTAIEATPTDADEAPLERIEIRHARVVRR